MPPKPRFTEPADNRRPYGTHRFEVWSPKIARRLKLFGQDAFQIWLAIEADPGILAFCERPLVRKGDRHNHVIDFWVQRRDGEELWVLLRPSEQQKTDAGIPLFAGFDEWARRQEMVVRYLRPAEHFLSEQAATNWRFILHHLAANRDLIQAPFLQRLRVAASAGYSFQELEREFADTDPVLVRTGVFTLVHQGVFAAEDLATTPLGADTRVAAS